MSCRCVKYHSFGITVFEISDGRYIYIYIYNRTAMWTGLKTPASPIGATAEKLVTRSNDSWSKSSEEVRASKKKKVLNVLASARVVCLWQSVREWSEACSLLYFFPLDEEKKKINYR